MLTGDLPFPSESTQTSMVMRLTEPPKTLAEMNPAIEWPAEVQQVMSKALARQPDDRYSSAREFGRALYSALARIPSREVPVSRTVAFDEPVSVTAPPPIAPAPPASRRAVTPPKRRELVIAVAIVAVLATIVVAVLLARNGARQSASAAALVEGITAYREGRRAAAAERFLAASREAPADPMPHVYLARLAREGNDLVTANVEAVKAVQLGPDNAAALRELASVSFVQGNFTLARSFYTRAITADPNDRLSKGYLGCSLIRLGRVDEGLRWIQRAGSGSWSSCVPAASAPAPTVP
jgi:tetratricopeptide (TPR) repeat protein